MSEATLNHLLAETLAKLDRDEPMSVDGAVGAFEDFLDALGADLAEVTVTIHGRTPAMKIIAKTLDKAAEELRAATAENFAGSEAEEVQGVVGDLAVAVFRSAYLNRLHALRAGVLELGGAHA